MRTSLLQSDITFLTNCLREYYYDNKRFRSIPVLNQIQQREFGYVKPGSKMIRHIQLADQNELRAMLMLKTPMEVYASNATYLFPDLPMAEKAWQQADVIFDIDSKDLNLGCRPSHTISICDACGTISTDADCRTCGHHTNSVSLPCDTCIEQARIETTKLLEMIHQDFGIKSSDVTTYFSGNEGFHVHITDADFSKLGSPERADIIDYLMFQGIIPDTLGMKRSRTRISDLPTYTRPGWPGRFARHMFKKQRTKKSTLVSAGYDSFAKLLPELKLGVKIDPNVTIDIRRIFRLAGTLNGKSAMPKTLCDIESFGMDSVRMLTGDDTVVRANCPISFRLGGTEFGPYNNEYVTVPAYAAAYMICKGLAHVMSKPHDTKTRASVKH